QLGISRAQVSYSLRRGNVSPKKRKRTSTRLKADDVDQIVSYVESSPRDRRKFFLELASGPFRHLGVSERVIQREHKKRIPATCSSSKASSISENYEDTQRMGRGSSQLDI
ncbi:Bgt-50378, partial [Blumeria graminis f. sp. tritici]